MVYRQKKRLRPGIKNHSDTFIGQEQPNPLLFWRGKLQKRTGTEGDQYSLIDNKMEKINEKHA
jgi:hypothetical protein